MKQRVREREREDLEVLAHGQEDRAGLLHRVVVREREGVCV